MKNTFPYYERIPDHNNIRDVDDFSPFVLLEVADFSGTVIELTGITIVDDNGDNTEQPTNPETGDNIILWVVLAVIALSVVVVDSATFIIYRKKRQVK